MFSIGDGPISVIMRIVHGSVQERKPNSYESLMVGPEPELFLEKTELHFFPN